MRSHGATRGQTTQRPLGRRDRRGQGGRAGEVRVDRGRGGPALGDRPDDQRLAAAGVAGDEDAVDAWTCTTRRARRCRARRARRRAARRRPARSGPVKPIASSTSSAGISRSVPATSAELPSRSTLDQPQRPHVAVVVAEELLGRDRSRPARRPPRGPRRPGRSSGTSATAGPPGRSSPRLRHDLQLGDRRGALPVRRAEAVGAGVAAADDHDVLAGRA